MGLTRISEVDGSERILTLSLWALIQMTSVSRSDFQGQFAPRLSRNPPMGRVDLVIDRWRVHIDNSRRTFAPFNAL